MLPTREGTAIPLSADTDRAAARAQIERWRAMPAADRAGLVDEASAAVTTMALAGIRALTDAGRQEQC